jgi:hypothetical protein
MINIILKVLSNEIMKRSIRSIILNVNTFLKARLLLFDIFSIAVYFNL